MPVEATPAVEEKRKQLTIRVSVPVYERVVAARPEGVSDSAFIEELVERGLGIPPLLTIHPNPSLEFAEDVIKRLGDYDPTGLAEFKRRLGIETKPAPAAKSAPKADEQALRRKHFAEAHEQVMGVINALTQQWGDRVDTRGPNGLRARVDGVLLENSA